MNKTEIKTINELLNRIEELGWVVEKEDENVYRLGNSSPREQDFSITIDLRDTKGFDENDIVAVFIHDIYEAYEDYDVSYEASLWIDSGGHGINGAPYELEDLVDDMKWCENEILELWENLNGKNEKQEGSKTYEITITRTGTIIVEAENEQEALDKVLSMSSEKIDETGNITGWQPSDVEEVE